MKIKKIFIHKLVFLKFPKSLKLELIVFSKITYKRVTKVEIFNILMI